MNRVKVAVQLPPDSPSDKETLWAESVGPDLYRLDNIPFYAKGIALDDIVEASKRGNEFPLL